MANDPADKVDISATLNGRDVLQIASAITISEDINSTFPRSTIHVARDSRYEMQEALAGHPINITLKSQNGPSLDVKHVVHSAKPQLHETGKGLSGVIDGVHEDFPKYIQQRTTKSWKDKNTDEAIKEIHKEVGAKSKLEVTSGMKKASFTSPSLMPRQAIEKAQGLSGLGSKGAFFVTHENGGKAHAKTFDDMTKKGPKRKFTYSSTGAANPNSIYDPNNVFDLQYEGSPVTTQKQTEAQGQRYNPSHGKIAQNDKPDKAMSTAGLGVQSAKGKSAFPTVNTVEQDKEKRHIDRDKQDLNKNTAKLKLLVPLATDIHAGDIIEVNSGSATYFNSGGNPDNAASGKWLVVSLVHHTELGGKEGTPHHTGRTILHCIGKTS